MMLQAHSLTVGYGAFQATHDLDFSIDKGSVFALIGANGAGKSSTIMAIAGHVAVLGGRIEFDDHDITALPLPERVRVGIGLAPEGRRLFPDLSVDENLAVGAYTQPKAAAAESRDQVLALFPRLGERLGQAAGTLSGGEQQMLAVGRALMGRPRFLMIDEVSLGLMPLAVDICYTAIERLKAAGMTILLVEQSTSRALSVADRVLVLESGRVVWQGSGDAARADPARLEAHMGLRSQSMED